MSNEFINIVIIIGAVAASIGAALGIFSLIRTRQRLIITIIDQKDSYDDRGFMFIEFHITNMTNRRIVISKFGLLYSDGNQLVRKVHFSLEPNEPYAETSGWQLWVDKKERRYIKYAFVEDTTGKIHKGEIPKAIKYYSQ